MPDITPNCSINVSVKKSYGGIHNCSATSTVAVTPISFEVTFDDFEGDGTCDGLQNDMLGGNMTAVASTDGTISIV